MPTLRRILIANRGEIAVRIIRACREVQATPCAIYSDPDRDALHVRLADEVHALGGSRPAESYLAIDKVIAAAKAMRCDAIHPGYGFLSENAGFAQAVEDAGLTFIGPTPASMRLMGDKVSARREARAAGLPVLEGGADPIVDADDLRHRAAEIGLPVMLKAAGGGGGKGIRVVREMGELVSSWERAASEATTAFGRSEVYVERYLEAARHIEVQVLGDGRGDARHLFERECSLQRRHQKVVEEAPSPSITEALRDRMTGAACALASRIRYRGAGTIEFLVEGQDDNARFYFMEMNTRLQVEHPVTELTTGIDLVREQLRIAAGEPIGWAQADLTQKGAAIEVRVCAEDPARGFVPAAGTVHHLRMPGGPGTRVDSALSQGDRVSLFYDPLLAKVIAFGRDRDEARIRLTRAVDEMNVGGLATTLPLLRRLVRTEAFARAAFHIHWLEPYTTRVMAEPPSRDEVRRAAIAVAVRAAMRAASQPLRANAHNGINGDRLSPWTLAGRSAQMTRLP